MNTYIHQCVCSTYEHPDKYLLEWVNVWMSEGINEVMY